MTENAHKSDKIGPINTREPPVSAVEPRGFVALVDHYDRGNDEPGTLPRV